jgi:Fur family ferric uptake transcriptional regulator
MPCWTDHAIATLERRWLPHRDRAADGRRAARPAGLLPEREGDHRGAAGRGHEVGLASVYRALELLDTLRLVQRLDAGEGVVRYEPADTATGHHHHIVCERCGDVAAYEDEALERAIHSLPTGSAGTSARTTSCCAGRCPGCAATRG